MVDISSRGSTWMSYGGHTPEHMRPFVEPGLACMHVLFSTEIDQSTVVYVRVVVVFPAGGESIN